MRRASSERGAISIEAALVLPIFLVVCLVFIGTISRNQQAASRAQSIANEAARAGSLQSTDDGAKSAIQKIIDESNNPDNHITCQVGDLETAMVPGGLVELTVSCTGKTVDLPGFLGVPVTQSATAYEVIDLFMASS